MKLVLGSQSKGRRKVLEEAGYEFEIITADIDEKAIRSEDYELLPLLIARAKAEAILKKLKDPAILITSDQVVVCNGDLREKPESIEHAREYLESYNNFPAQTNTAVVVINTKTGKRAEIVDIARATLKNVPGSVINKLLEEGAVLHTAGGFMVEHPLLQPYVEHIEGDINSIIGLPLKVTEELMQQVQ